MLRISVISSLTILSLACNLRAESLHTKEPSIKNYFISILEGFYPSYFFGKLEPKPKSEDQIYAEKIAERMKESRDYDVELPDGWKLVPHKTFYSDHLKGWVVDANGVPRVSYTGKSAFYDSYLYAYAIEEEEALLLKAEKEQEEQAQKPERDAEAKLKSIMPETIYERYMNLEWWLYGDACRRGWGRLWEPTNIEIIVNWYKHEGGEEQMDGFLKDHKDTEAGRRFSQFREMFAGNHRISDFIRICTEMDGGMASILGEIAATSNLYKIWKEKRKHKW